jgi:hypothetical protein
MLNPRVSKSVKLVLEATQQPFSALPTDLLVYIWSLAIVSVSEWGLWQSVHRLARTILRQPALISQLRLTVFKADLATGFGNLAVHVRHLDYPLPHFQLAANALAVGNSRLRSLSALSGLQSLSCQGVAACSHASFERLARLRHLKLSHSVVRADLLSQFGQLETLSLDTTNVCNSDLQTVAVMLNLSTLELHHCTAVTDDGLFYLRGLTCLRVLKLRYLAHVTNVGVSAIAPLSWLETLDLTSTRVNDHCDLSPFVALRRLALAQTNVTGATLPALPNLRWLDLDGTKAGGAFIKLLPNFTHLEEVRLRHTLASDADFRAVRLPPSLRALHIDVSKLTGQGFAHPAGLHVLRMGYCGATDSSLRSLSSFPHLAKLDLTANASLTSEGLCALWPLRSLTTLNLNECLHLAHVAPLSAMASLRNLDFSWCKNLRDARALTALTELESLDLSHTAVDNKGVPAWPELKNLRRLRLTRTLIDDAGLEGLDLVRGLERLDLHRTRVTDACMSILSAIQSLVSLDVSGTLITTTSLVSHVQSVFHWRVPNFLNAD